MTQASDKRSARKTGKESRNRKGTALLTKLEKNRIRKVLQKEGRFFKQGPDPEKSERKSEEKDRDEREGETWNK